MKPGHEPICIARKPFRGTVAANVTEHGTGAINVDGCRIDLDGDYKSKPNGRPSLTALGDNYDPEQANKPDTVGRWPANVVLDEEAGAVLDAQTGTLSSNSGKAFRRGADEQRNAYGKFAGNIEYDGFYGDSGGASRFFYCAKADRAEREIGMQGVDAKPLLWSSGEQSPGTFQAEGTNRTARNNHPTVKPISLMQWLVRLVTPPGGTVLDPFAGSGTTGIACEREGFNSVLVEINPEYAGIIERRVRGASPLFTDVTVREVRDGQAIG